MTVTDFPEKASPVVDLGPKNSGFAVIVDGRHIKQLAAYDHGDQIEFVLDGRFSYSVPRDWSKLFATAMAQSLAIGAGFSHLGAETRDRCFARRIAFLGDATP